MAKRPLTAGEIALVKSVFGDSVNCDTVSVHDNRYTRIQRRGVAMAPNGSLYMPGCYFDDYSKKEPHLQSLFIHEMTHVWQHQNKVLNPVLSFVGLNLSHKFNYTAAYDYTLDPKKDLLDYNMEQQASIVQDYFLLRATGNRLSTSHCNNTCDTEQKMALYGQVLGQFLKDPGYAKRKTIFHRRPKPQPPSA